MQSATHGAAMTWASWATALEKPSTCPPRWTFCAAGMCGPSPAGEQMLLRAMPPLHGSARPYISCVMSFSNAIIGF